MGGTEEEGRPLDRRLRVEAAREALEQAVFSRAEGAPEEDQVARPGHATQGLGDALRPFGIRREPESVAAHERPRGLSVATGITSSSIDTPPCWNEPRNWRSNSWKRVG